MKIHLLGSARDIENDLPYYDKIFETVYLNGGTIILDWVHAMYSRYKRQTLGFDELDWETVFKENIKALSEADLVIVEATTQSFYQGFYTALALEQNKPTLLVTRRDITGRSIWGLPYESLTIKQYTTDKELANVINTFLDDNTIVDRRVNLPFSRKINDFIEKQASEQQVSNVQVIENIILNEIRKR